MRLTCLKIKGKRATEKQTKDVARKILNVLTKHGFKTETDLISSTGIRIGLHMNCFRVNIKKLGYNARVHSGYNGMGQIIKCFNTVAGYKKTSLPTWDQRVEFNNLINDLLDQMKASARIQSGTYIVRSVNNGRYNENDWYDQTPSYISIYSIVKLTNEMEQEAKRIRKIHTRKIRSIARDKANGRLVEVFTMYGERHDSHGVMTMTEYQDYKLSMSTGDYHMHYIQPVLKTVNE